MRPFSSFTIASVLTTFLAGCASSSGGPSNAAGASGAGGSPGGGAGGTVGSSGSAGQSAASGAGGAAAGSGGSGGAGAGGGSGGGGGAAGAAGTGGTGGAGGAGWCAIKSPECAATLAPCNAFTACQADAACADAVQKMFTCICAGEQTAANGDTVASTCAMMFLGAPGTPSGDVTSCFGKMSPSPPVCFPAIPPGCNDLQIVDPLIDELDVAQAAPTPSGGSIADGTYVLTAAAHYKGVGGSLQPNPGLHETIAIAGGVMQTVTAKVGEKGQRTTKTMAISGTTLTLTWTCPLATTEKLEFDAAPTQLRLYAGSHVKTFTRQ